MSPLTVLGQFLMVLTSVFVKSSEGVLLKCNCSSFFGSRPEVRASGNTESWCAGAVETVTTFVERHRVWYHWFLVAPVGWLLALLTYGAGIAMALVPKEFKVPPIAVIAWLGLTLAVLLLYISRAKLLPVCALEIRDQNGFLRKHVAELSLLVAIVSAILTVVGWFFTK